MKHHTIIDILKDNLYCIPVLIALPLLHNQQVIQLKGANFHASQKRQQTKNKTKKNNTKLTINKTKLRILQTKSYNVFKKSSNLKTQDVIVLNVISVESLRRQNVVNLRHKVW